MPVEAITATPTSWPDQVPEMEHALQKSGLLVGISGFVGSALLSGYQVCLWVSSGVWQSLPMATLWQANDLALPDASLICAQWLVDWVLAIPISLILLAFVPAGVGMDFVGGRKQKARWEAWLNASNSTRFSDAA